MIISHAESSVKMSVFYLARECHWEITAYTSSAATPGRFEPKLASVFPKKKFVKLKLKFRETANDVVTSSTFMTSLRLRMIPNT